MRCPHPAPLLPEPHTHAASHAACALHTCSLCPICTQCPYKALQPSQAGSHLEDPHHAQELVGQAARHRCHQWLHPPRLHHQQIGQATLEGSVLAAGAGELKVGAEVRLDNERPGRSRVTCRCMHGTRHTVGGQCWIITGTHMHTCTHTCTHARGRAM